MASYDPFIWKRTVKLAPNKSPPPPTLCYASCMVGNKMIKYGGDAPTRGCIDIDHVQNSLHVYDFSTGRWSKLKLDGGAPGITEGTLVEVNQAAYLVAGQNGRGYVNDVYKITSSDQWKKKAKIEKVKLYTNVTLPSRAAHTAIAYKDKIYVYGGYNGRKTLSDLFIFDTTHSSWTKFDSKKGFINMYASTSQPPPLRTHGAGAWNGIMYIVGGYTGTIDVDITKLYRFDMKKQKWLKPVELVLPEGVKKPPPRVRIGVSVTQDTLTVMGGWNRAMNVFYNDVWSVNLKTLSMTKTINDVPWGGGTSQICPVFVPFLNSAFVFGGYNSSSKEVTDTMWAVENVWTPN